MLRILHIICTQVLYPKSYRCVHCHAAYILLGVHLECKEPRCSKVREIIRLGGWILGGAGQINCSLLFQKTTSYKNNYQIHFAAGLRRHLSVQKDQSRHSGETGCHHYKQSIKVLWYHSYLVWMLFGDPITSYTSFHFLNTFLRLFVCMCLGLFTSAWSIPSTTVYISTLSDLCLQRGLFTITSSQVGLR